MNDFLKWCLKTVFSAVVWVFVLSITVNGRTMFSYAHDTLVDNAVVDALDTELAEAWLKLQRATRTAFTGEKAVAEEDRKS